MITITDRCMTANNASNRVINRETLQGVREDIGPRFTIFLEKFLHNLTDDLSTLASARFQDRDEFKQAVHKLKGLSALFGAERFALLCGELEIMAVHKQPTRDEETLIQTLLQEGESLRQELQKELFCNE